jgi:branched-chain amino acid transport system substrate-binding protein
VIKIGAVLPLTGVTAYYGTTIKQGIDLVLDEIAAQGGINGKKIEVIYEDDKGTPAEAVNATQKLITQDHVSAIIGAHSSSNTLAMRDVTEREKVVHMTPASGADSITEPGHPYMFRYTLYNGQQGPALARYVTGKLNLKDVAIIAENSDFGRTGAEAFKKTMENEGLGNVLSLEFYKQGDKDFYPQLTKIKNMNPSAILISGNITEGAQLIKQIRDLGMNTQLFGFASLANDKFIELAGKSAEGIISIGTFEPGDYNYFPNSKKMVETYKQKYGKNPDMQVANGYGSMQIFAEAIRLAGGGDREKIREGMKQLKEFQGVTGPVTFNENNQSYQMLIFEKLENGKYVVIGSDKDMK